jgi:hypothetical protein
MRWTIRATRYGWSLRKDGGIDAIHTRCPWTLLALVAHEIADPRAADWN